MSISEEKKEKKKKPFRCRLGLHPWRPASIHDADNVGNPRPGKYCPKCHDVR